MGASAGVLDPLLTIPEVAETLRRSRSSVYELIKSGDIPAVKIGRRGVRVRRATLDVFIESRESRGVR